MSKDFIILISILTGLSSCVKEKEVSNVDQKLLGNWELYQTTIVEVKEGKEEVVDEYLQEFSKNVIVSFFEDGSYFVDQPIRNDAPFLIEAFYAAINSVDEYGGIYGVEERGKYVNLDKGVPSLNDYADEKLLIEILDDSRVVLSNIYLDSLQDFQGGQDSGYSYVTRRTAPEMGREYGRYRGNQINVKDENSGWHDGFKSGYSEYFEVNRGSVEPSFYSRYFKFFVIGLEEQKNQSGESYEGTSYQSGFEQGKLDGAASCIAELSEPEFPRVIPDGVKVTYTFRR